MGAIFRFCRDYWHLMRGKPWPEPLEKMTVEELWREAEGRAADRQGKS